MAISQRSSAILGILSIVLCLGCLADQRNTESENKELVRQLYAAIDVQDYGEIESLLTEDFNLMYVGMPEPLSRGMTLDLIRGFYSAFPDYTHTIEELVAEDNLVAAKFSYNATHQGDFEGIPPTGNEVRYAGAQIIRIVDGKIDECWALEDNLGLMMQLGMQLAPSTQ
ncbi:MAG: ester cyclase [bacterium]|nr:ester cyclase [bacterium]